MRQLFLLLAIPTAAWAQKPVWPDEGPRKWAPRPTTAEITANDLRTRLYQFADDSMKGRRIGELGNHKGTDYIASEFKRMGLKPAGDNGTYFQTLAYGPQGFDADASKLVAGGTTLRTKTDWAPTAPSALNGFGVSASLSNAAVVYAGRLGDTATVLDPAMFAGKVAVFSGPAGNPQRPAAVLRCDSVPNKFGAANAAAVEAAVAAGRAGGAGGAGGRGGAAGGAARDPRLLKLGAAAILVIGGDSLPTATVTSAFGGRMGMAPAAPTASAVGMANITRGAAAQLFGKPVDQLTVGTSGTPVTASWKFDFNLSKWPARNVIAILPGSDPARAGEYVLVSAHNDHVGTLASPVDHDSLRAVNMVVRPQGANDPVCRPSPEQQHKIDSLIARARKIRPIERDSIMNGADDDGSGTVIMMEIAERFAKEKPARSIIFVSHEGEEAGLLGSKWFTDHPTIPLESIVAAHNMDMEAKGHTWEVKFGGPTSLQTLGSRRLSREFGDIIDSVNATRGQVMAIDKSWDVVANPMNRFCRSDQVNYVNHNVPVTYFSTGYALDYHQASDEPRYADYDHMAAVGNFIHDVMMAIAMRKDKPAIAGADPNYPSCGRG